MIKRFTGCRSGGTAIEYALIAALVSIVIVAALTSIGVKLNAMFNGLAGGLK